MAMPPVPAPSSLARSTLVKMGARIAVLVFLTTLFSYLHIFDALRTEALVQLERSVVERGQREQAIFVLAEDNHVILKQALEEHTRAWSQKDPGPAFEQLVRHEPDGTLRTRPEGFDGTRMPCVFVPEGREAGRRDAPRDPGRARGAQPVRPRLPRALHRHVRHPARGGRGALLAREPPAGARTPRATSTRASTSSSP